MLASADPELDEPDELGVLVDPQAAAIRTTDAATATWVAFLACLITMTSRMLPGWRGAGRAPATVPPRMFHLCKRKGQHSRCSTSARIAIRRK